MQNLGRHALPAQATTREDLGPKPRRSPFLSTSVEQIGRAGKPTKGFKARLYKLQQGVTLPLEHLARADELRDAAPAV
jgi:hypothetical protein